MDDIKHQTTMTPEAKRRGVIVVFFSIFPLLLPSFVFAAIYLFTDLDSHRSVGQDTKHASIVYPIKEQRVSDKFEAKGVVKGIPDGYVAYLTTSSDDLYWPKTKVNTGEWSLNMSASGEPGYKYNLSIVALPTADQPIIEKWFKKGKETGQYPPLPKPSNLKVLATVKVKK